MKISRRMALSITTYTGYIETQHDGNHYSGLLSIKIFNIMAHSTTTFSIATTAHGIMTLSMTAFIIVTFSIKTIRITAIRTIKLSTERHTF
jgi:hypothetical protein